MRARVVSYPLPPHGHHPNFTGAARAADALLAHPRLASLDVLIVGPERTLYPARKLALTQGRTLYVPDQRREGWYVRLQGSAKGAELRRMLEFGEPRLNPEGALGAIVGSVVVDARGERLSKGFGWSARGLGLGLPEFTLAHPLMVRSALGCEADSRVALIATPGSVIVPEADGRAT